MKAAPQEPRVPRWIETVAPEDRSTLHNAIVAFAFAVVCIVPPAIRPDFGWLGEGWAYWPPLVLVAVLGLCMLDDHVDRSPRDRVRAVVWHVGVFFVMFAMITPVLHPSDDPIPLRAGYRAIVEIAPLLFGLNSSRTMVRWAHHSQRIRYDRSGDPYLQ